MLIYSRNIRLVYQYTISISCVLAVALFCFWASNLIAYKTVALLLLVTVSVQAMLFDMMPVVTACVLSALIWNFFFIPPILTFHIANAEDLLMFLLYFCIALVNTLLSFQIRKAEEKARGKEEKEKAILLYNTLLNSLSHELKTPLSTMIGSVDILKENKQKLTQHQQDELLQQISIAGLRLNAQVENLLNMSRLESGMLTLKKDWCDIPELVYTALHKYFESSVHKIIFNPDPELPLVQIDRGLMEQVLQNLVFNAIQYTPENLSIQIQAHYIQEHLKISITDNGPGIPKAELQPIFQKFYRLPQSRAGGCGLGLSIVKGIVEAHQGKVWAENNANGGATFYIDIPATATYFMESKNE